jgi:hypothetical protein
MKKKENDIKKGLSKTGAKKAVTKSSPNSTAKIAAGVAAASGASLIAVGLIGAAPAALAGAAGYLAYNGLKKPNKKERAVSPNI